VSLSYAAEARLTFSSARTFLDREIVFAKMSGASAIGAYLYMAACSSRQKYK
jgi:hypothetical protein